MFHQLKISVYAFYPRSQIQFQGNVSKVHSSTRESERKGERERERLYERETKYNIVAHLQIFRQHKSTVFLMQIKHNSIEIERKRAEETQISSFQKY